MIETFAIQVKSVHKQFRTVRHKQSIKQIFTSLDFLKRRKKRSSRAVLSGITLEIKKGEFFGIVGRNGCGKSTLLKILAGIYQPTKGSVAINGKLVPFIELGVGFNPELSGLDNVYLNGALLGYTRKHIKSKYSEIVEFAELKGYMDQKLKNFSSGMQVRLAFSVATLLADSDILLLDEVLAVGDSAFQQKCFGYFKELKKQKKTVILVSHDMSTVREYCDRAALIDKGVIKMIGGVEHVANEYLALFMKDRQAIARTGHSNDRWGLGDVSIMEKDIKVSRGTIRINMSLKVNRAVDECVLGFSINEQGGEQIILGTNTEYLGINALDHMSDSKLNITFELPNVLRRGKYTYGLSVHGRSGSPVYDWWDNAGHFTITSKRTSPYVITPKIDVSFDQ